MTPILYENGPFWVCAAKFDSGHFKPKSKGFEVWQSLTTHSVRRAIIGYKGEEGLSKAIAQADRLANAEQSSGAV